MKVTKLEPPSAHHHNGQVRQTALLGAGAIAAGAAVWALRRQGFHARHAPGWPGDSPRWNFSSKDGVGSALDPASQVWFTFRNGILTEVFYPRVDLPAIRQCGLVVTDGRGFYSEEPDDIEHRTECLADGIPAYRLLNTDRQGRYRVEKAIFAHPRRPAILQRIQFTPLRGSSGDFHLHAMVNPHLGNQGHTNSAWIEDDGGLLVAEGTGLYLALACSVPWRAVSVGYHGSSSDGRRVLRQDGRLARTYGQARHGNVILMGEVDHRAGDATFVLALGFGRSPEEAGESARVGLDDDFEALQEEYTRGWRAWQERLQVPDPPAPGGRDLARISAVVLRIHEDKENGGAIVASLSTPWGQARDDDNFGRTGYHVVWPRDLVENAGGLLAIGATEEAVRVLDYLERTQQDDGHWPQNQWVDGTQNWEGIQLGETALPILLVGLLQQYGAIGPDRIARSWPMVRKAISYIAQHGPSSQQDRWEDERGFTPFTLSVLIAAKLVAADLAEAQGEASVATFLRETADAWYGSLDDWTYVRGSRLARRAGVEGHYLRIAPPDHVGNPQKHDDHLKFSYRSRVEKDYPPARIVSPDALAYVRFGLRAPDDPHMVNTVKVIDAILKVETPCGPCWHRYNQDGYGEKVDGEPFDNKRGHGRAWPLMTGERAHYELAAGRRDEAVRLLRAFEAFAGDGGLIPEQVWDTYDIPKKGLFFGRPSGSAMPLVWAHSEYLKLRRSLQDGSLFDLPSQTVQRYLVEKVRPRHQIWRTNHQRRTIPAGMMLRVELHEPALVHYTTNGDRDGQAIPTRDSGLDIHYADLPTDRLAPGSEVAFTITWQGGTPLRIKQLRALWPFIVVVE